MHDRVSIHDKLDKLYKLATVMEEKSYEKKEIYNEREIDELSGYYQNVITNIGENPGREGLVKTPVRAAKAMKFLTHGYSLDPKLILESALFKEDYRQIVVVKDIESYSLCEHHLLPFSGRRTSATSRTARLWD